MPSIDAYIDTWIHRMEQQDPSSRGHAARTAIYALALGQKLGLSSEQLDYMYLYVENQLAINPAADRRKLEQKGRGLAAKWAAQGPTRFAREMQLQTSREYQRVLDEEDLDRNKEIYE